MNIKSLWIYSQNVRKNKTLTDTILETEKNNSNIILIQEPSCFVTKYIPFPTIIDNDPIYGHLSHPKWVTFVRTPDNQDDIPRAIVTLANCLSRD